LREEQGPLINDNDGRPAERRAGTRKRTGTTSSAKSSNAARLTGFGLGKIEE